MNYLSLSLTVYVVISAVLYSIGAVSIPDFPVYSDIVVSSNLLVVIPQLVIYLVSFIPAILQIIFYQSQYFVIDLLLWMIRIPAFLQLLLYIKSLINPVAN